MFRKWRTLTTHSDENTKKFLEIMKKHIFRVYAIRERPEYLCPGIPYSEACESNIAYYCKSPKITIYILTTLKEFGYVNSIWQKIAFKMPSWMRGDTLEQQVNVQNNISPPSTAQTIFYQTPDDITQAIQSCYSMAAQDQEIARLRAMLEVPICSMIQTANMYQSACDSFASQRAQLDAVRIMSTRDEILYADNKPYLTLTDMK